MLVMEKKRRSIKEVIEGKEESADFKANLKKKRRSQRLGIIFKPNVLPAMAAAGQIPPRMPPRNSASQMPPPNAAGQMPPPNAVLMQEPIIEEIPSNPRDELMLEL